MSGINASSATSSTNGQLGTGIDVASTVASLMQVQELPEQQMQSQQTQLNAQAQAIQAINNNLSSLQASVQALTNFTGPLNALTTSSSNTSLLMASADSTATPGQYQIVINNLATTSSEYTNEVANSSTPIATGSFSIQVGSATPVSISVNSSNNTLSGIAQAINAANAGVTATVITDSAGSRLSLLSSTSGAAGNITISNNTTGLTFNQAVQGKDASLQVDGIPIDSASNTVQNVLPGVTLNLVGANPNSTVTLSVSADVTQATSAIQSFVSAYNTAIQAVNAQSNYNPSSGASAPPLLGDSSLDMVQEQLYSAISYSTSGSGGINSLADLGITVNNDGTLSVNSGQLAAALSSNNGAALNFLQTASSGFAQQLNSTLENLTNPVSGALNVDLSGINSSVSSLQSQITDFQAQMAAVQQQLTTQYDSVNTTLQQLPILLQQINSQLGSVG